MSEIYARKLEEVPENFQHSYQAFIKRLQRHINRFSMKSRTHASLAAGGVVAALGDVVASGNLYPIHLNKMADQMIEIFKLEYLRTKVQNGEITSDQYFIFLEESNIRVDRDKELELFK